MGKEEVNNGARGGSGGALELALNQGAASVAEATAKAETKSAGGDSNAPHSYQLPDPLPNLFFSDDDEEDEDSDNDDDEKNGGGGNFGRNGEREDGLGLVGTSPAEDSAAASSLDQSEPSALQSKLQS